MSIKFTCDDKQTLISYLYGEVDHDTRQAVDAHLTTCVACSDEVTALGDARSELGLWVPPDVELDFTIVKKSQLPPADVLRPARWWSTVPVWAQAAAAILVLAVGVAIANLQIRSGPEGFVVTTGWMSAPAAAGAPSVRVASGPEVEGWKPALVALEQQLRTEIRSTRDQDTAVGARTPVDEATIRRVQQLIAASEQRHEQQLAKRFVEFTLDMNMQRRADLMKISQGFDDYNGQLLRQRQMMNNMIRVSTTPQQ
jgi:hypothetical protein